MILRPDPYIYHIGEAVVGDGIMDCGVMLGLLAERSPSTSLMAEHLHSEDDARRANTHMRALTGRLGLELS